MKNKVLIYGAMGYMGQLFSRIAQPSGLPIVLAARDEKLLDQAKKLGLDARIFSLDNPKEIEQHLIDIKVVVNLAGPFSSTCKPLITACIATTTHYIDIAGEYAEFEAAYQFNAAAQAAGVMLMPGAGFGVVPTDIAAFLAKEALQDADDLTIAYSTKGGASQGTLKTILKDINKTGVLRKNGVFVPSRPASSSLQLAHLGKSYQLVSNPWRADLFTAYYSTGIGNIETFSVFPGFIVSFMKGKMLWLRDFMLRNIVGLLPIGPSERALQSGSTLVWAIAKNAKQQQTTITIEGPEAYLFTAHCVRNIVHAILQNNIKAGFQTPSIYGTAIIENIGGVVVRTTTTQS